MPQLPSGTEYPVARGAIPDVSRQPVQPYWSPYVAGVGLGLTLLAAFVLFGRGLGASGAFNSVLAWIMVTVAPARTNANEFLAPYLGDGTSSPLKAWLVFEVGGVFLGAWLSGALAGRLRAVTERGPRASVAARLVLAFAGGTIMAFGAALARGCTSGQALTGGATLNAGSWAFMIMVFVGGYAAAPFMRRQWR